MIRRLTALIEGLFVFLLLSAAPAFAAPQELTVENKSYDFGPVHLVITLPAGNTKGLVNFTVSSSGAAPVTLTMDLDPDMQQVLPSLSLVEMDASNSTPEFLVQRFSGGAHCCAQVQILDLVGSAWTIVEGGSWDGDAIVPEDVDGDGEYEIVHGDDRFLYVFSCYACATPPTRYFKLVQGTLTDVTSSPLYRKFDEKEVDNLKSGCAGHDNGSCASYVAVATRLGKHDEAWQYMLANYDKTTDWGLSTCASYDAQSNCIGKTSYANYPEALQSFLSGINAWQPVRP